MSKRSWLLVLLVGIGSVAAAGSALAQAQTTSMLYPSGIEVSAGIDGSFLSGPQINGFSTVIGGSGVAFRREIDPTISPQGWAPIGQASISFPLPAWNGARLKFSGQGGTVSSTFAQTQVLSAADFHNILYIDGSPTSGLPTATAGNVNTTAAAGNYSYALGSVSVEFPAPGPVWNNGFASVEVGVAGMWSDTSWNVVETGQVSMLRMTLNESATTWYGGPMVGFNFVKPVSEQVRFVSQSHLYLLVSSADLSANQTALQTGTGFRNISVNGNFSNLTGRLDTTTGFEWNIGVGRLGAYGVGSVSETPSIVNPYSTATSGPFASHGPVAILNGLTWSASAELRLTIPLN